MKTEINKILKKIIFENGYTYVSLAKKLNMNESSVHKLLYCDDRYPRFKTLCAITKLCGYEIQIVKRNKSYQIKEE